MQPRSLAGLVRQWVSFSLVLLASVCLSPCHAAAVDAEQPSLDPIGPYAQLVHETDQRLSLEAAVAAYRAGQFKPARSEILSFGIDSKPVWVRFEVSNATSAPLSRNLVIGTSWLDEIEVFFLSADSGPISYRSGDLLPHPQRSFDSPDFLFAHDFVPGRTEVFLRIETPDPMVLPIWLLTQSQTESRALSRSWTYGLIYGYLLALLSYNMLLYLSLGSSRYPAYALYLAAFLLMNTAYTGQGFAWLWPQDVAWQQWSNPVLILTYCLAGLNFAIRFLGARKHFAGTYESILWSSLALSLAFIGAVIFDDRALALLIAFTAVLGFSLAMLWLGIIAIWGGQTPARYFLTGTLGAAIGSVITLLSVWGFIPYHTWTFRAVEIGMLVDATLLAFALAYQFRLLEKERERVDRLAERDSLTGLLNRRGLTKRLDARWNMLERSNLSAAAIIIDADHFKAINDRYGHPFGDIVLGTIANTLAEAARISDFVSRWGGEEFLAFLPNTSLAQALKIAERMRAQVADLRFSQAGEEVSVTISLGVAALTPETSSFDQLIAQADEALYRAKIQGRNRVCQAPAVIS